MVYDRTLVIFGEPASKANSRRLVTIKGRPASIKSAKANSYAEAFRMQCALQVMGVPMTAGDVRVEMVIHYASRRPDLDESVILDAMQGLVYVNDRQVKQKAVYWALDKDNPRAVIRIVECNPDNIPAHLKT
ncbi:MAG: RusA family crossover junction endodeoxyribonuclease [Pseudomonas sp.]